MELTRAQKKLIQRVAERNALPPEKRYGTMYRMTGRGMAGTCKALAKLGLITYEEHMNRLTTTCSFEVYLTGQGREVAAALGPRVYVKRPSWGEQLAAALEAKQ